MDYGEGIVIKRLINNHIEILENFDGDDKKKDTEEDNIEDSIFLN